MIRATIDGLVKEASPRMVAQRRGKKVADILNDKPGRQVAAPAGAPCPAHRGAEGPGVGEQEVTHLGLASTVPVRLGRQPGAEVRGGHSLLMRRVDVSGCHHLPATRP